MSEYLTDYTNEEFKMIMAESFLLVCSQVSEEELSMNSRRETFRNLADNLFSLIPESIGEIDLGNFVLTREVDGEKARAWNRDDIEAYFKTRRKNAALLTAYKG